MAEYRFGLLRSGRRRHIEQWLDRLERESVMLTIDERTARCYAEVRDRLRAAGTPISENDVWVAALAAQHRLPVVTCDRHFDLVAGLTRIGW